MSYDPFEEELQGRLPRSLMRMGLPSAVVDERRPGLSVIDVEPSGSERLAELEKQGRLPSAFEQSATDGSRQIYVGEALSDPALVPSDHAPRPTPALLLKLGAQTRQYGIGPGLWVHRTGPARTWEVYQEVQRIALAWASPYGAPSTAGNFEVLAMNAIHFEQAFGRVMDQRELTREEWESVSGQMSVEFWRVYSTVQAFWEVYGVDADKEPLGFEDFLPLWHDSGFPRLEVGHKLAAALCCTDVPPEIEVRAPWPAWCLVVPDGLFEEWGIARLWCTGAEWTAWIAKEGSAFGAPKPGEVMGSCGHDGALSAGGVAALHAMIRNLIRGACLSISEPDEHRKKGAHGGGQSKNHRHGPPDLQQARFILAAPVVIDLREHVAGVSSGRTSTAPKVQFLVRGHWREQAHGAAHQLRKRIWIQPFWKGPEAARVLLRSHALKK